MLLLHLASVVLSAIMTDKKAGNGRGYVIVAGAPAVGKTHLSRSVRVLYPRIQHIEMESYFRETREERRALRLNGFDIEAYNTVLMHDHHASYANAQSFVVRSYDHGVGFLPSETTIVPDLPVILEGFAFLSLLRDYARDCIAAYFVFPANLPDWFDVHVGRDKGERPTPEIERTLYAEASQKLVSLAASMNRFEECFSSITFVSMVHGVTEDTNQYSFVSHTAAERFLNEIRGL